MKNDTYSNTKTKNSERFLLYILTKADDYESEINDKNSTVLDSFVIKLEMPDESIEIEKLYEILKNLKILCVEIGKLLKIPSANINFRLHNIQSGSITMSFILSVVGEQFCQHIFIPLLEGLLKKEFKNLDDVFKATGALLREVFIYILCKKNETLYVDNFQKLKNAKENLYKCLDSIPNIKSLYVSTNGKTVKIKKKNFKDYYA